MAIEIGHQYELHWLPKEIWITIFEVHQLRGGCTTTEGEIRDERARLDTLLSISSTCRAFYHLVRPILYRTLHLDIPGIRAGWTSLFDTLVEDPSVWQHVRQVRLLKSFSHDEFPGLELGTGSASEKKPKLLVHLEVLGISPDLIHDIVQHNLELASRRNIVVPLLLCLCRNIRAFDFGSDWRAATNPGISLLLSKILSERERTPTPTAIQARPALLLGRRPCAVLECVRIARSKSIKIEEVGEFLSLPSLQTLDISDIYSTSRPDPSYRHVKQSQSWALRSLKFEACTVSACFVVDVLRICRLLRSLELDPRHTPGRPAFRYDHVAENLMHYNRQLEILICRDYPTSNRVAILQDKLDSLRPLASLRTLALPLGVLWPLWQPECQIAFETVLPTSLKELRIVAVNMGSSRGKGESCALSLLKLMGSEEYANLISIKISGHALYPPTIYSDLVDQSHGWKAEWDEAANEHVYTRRAIE